MLESATKLTLSTITAVALSFVANFWKVYGGVIICVGVAIIFDLVSALIKNGSRGTISASACQRGFWKKCATLGILVTAIFIDFAITACLSSFLNFEDFKSPFGVIVGVYIILTELISIISNFTAVNSSVVPKWLKSLIANAKDNIDKMSK